VPGRYTVTLEQRVDGETNVLAGPAEFEAKVLGAPSLPATERESKLAFQQQAGRLQRAALGAARAAAEAAERLEVLKYASEVTPGVSSGTRDEIRDMEVRLLDLRHELEGDPTRSSRSEPAVPGILDRVGAVVGGQWSNTAAPTGTQRAQLALANDLFTAMVERLRKLVDEELPALEDRLEAAGVPWTPGRGVPSWPAEH